jgi:hypothetical protein
MTGDGDIHGPLSRSRAYLCAYPCSYHKGLMSKCQPVGYPLSVSNTNQVLEIRWALNFERNFNGLSRQLSPVREKASYYYQSRLFESAYSIPPLYQCITKVRSPFAYDRASRWCPSAVTALGGPKSSHAPTCQYLEFEVHRSPAFLSIKGHDCPITDWQLSCGKLTPGQGSERLYIASE